MSTNRSILPKEVIALVQHIELNKAGWWDIQNLRLARDMLLPRLSSGQVNPTTN